MGAIGTRLVPLLVAAGHAVLCPTRSPDKTEARCRASAKPVIADVVDANALLEPWQRIAVSVLRHWRVQIPAIFTTANSGRPTAGGYQTIANQGKYTRIESLHP